MPAYFSRSAISSARVPVQVALRTWPASTSKSASQIHEMSRPSAIRSLRASQRSWRPSSSVRVRRTSFAPAGFLISRMETLRPSMGIVSTRPNAPPNPSSARADGGQRHAQLERRGRGGDGVVDVVEAGQGEGQLELARGRAQSDPGAAHSVELDRGGGHLRGRAAGGRSSGSGSGPR